MFADAAWLEREQPEGRRQPCLRRGLGSCVFSQSGQGTREVAVGGAGEQRPSSSPTYLPAGRAGTGGCWHLLGRRDWPPALPLSVGFHCLGTPRPHVLVPLSPVCARRTGKGTTELSGMTEILHFFPPQTKVTGCYQSLLITSNSLVPSLSWPDPSLGLWDFWDSILL